jgi:hypothetical protein
MCDYSYEPVTFIYKMLTKQIDKCSLHFEIIFSFDRGYLNILTLKPMNLISTYFVLVLSKLSITIFILLEGTMSI